MSLLLVLALLATMDGGTPAPRSDDDELIENLELLSSLKDVEDLDVVMELDEGAEKKTKP